MSDAAGSQRYGLGAQLAHRVAFVHPAVQRALADIEEASFAAELGPPQLTSPVFVTGLPRSGTTLLLNLLYGSGAFASFTYRQMPFIHAPLLWDRLSRGGRVTVETVERAHGDGMQVSVDSPEAFEEVIWLSWLKDDIVAAGHLRALAAVDLTPEFRRAFVRTAARLITLNERSIGRSLRYLSKNNANLARLEALDDLCADATVVVAARSPLAQARSLMAQHRRFSALHRRDPFARAYMRWIGHHDFGANFLPQQFDEPVLKVPTNPGLDFWLEYWRQAYTAVRDRPAGNRVIITYERLRADPAVVLSRLAERVGLTGDALLSSTIRVQASESVEVPGELRALYDELRARSL